MSRTKIEWADIQWNPVTGCLGKCNYCYSRVQAKRFSGDQRWNKRHAKYEKEGDMFILHEPLSNGAGGITNTPFGFSPTFHEYRLDRLDKIEHARNILVCGEGDLFGPWVPVWIIRKVLETTEAYEHFHFLFLTAYPERYTELAKIGALPAGNNYWYGQTVTKGTATDPFKDYPWFNQFVVAEPLHGPIKLECPWSWLIIGAEVGKQVSKVQCNPEWIKETLKGLNKDDGYIFMSETIKELLPEGEAFLQEYPDYLAYSEFQKEKLFDCCMDCGNRMKKSDMYAVTVKKGKRGSSYTIGFKCPECLKSELDDMGLELPEL